MTSTLILKELSSSKWNWLKLQKWLLTQNWYLVYVEAASECLCGVSGFHLEGQVFSVCHSESACIRIRLSNDKQQQRVLCVDRLRGNGFLFSAFVRYMFSEVQRWDEVPGLSVETRNSSWCAVRQWQNPCYTHDIKNWEVEVSSKFRNSPQTVNSLLWDMLDTPYLDQKIEALSCLRRESSQRLEQPDLVWNTKMCKLSSTLGDLALTVFVKHWNSDIVGPWWAAHRQQVKHWHASQCVKRRPRSNVVDLQHAYHMIELLDKLLLLRCDLFRVVSKQHSTSIISN